MIVVGGHTRSIGKTQLVCDLISALPDARFVAGKITQYGHGVCAQNGHDCDCAPNEHVSAFSWETGHNQESDSGRFMVAGARKSFWLRTKQGFLAEGLPLLRSALAEVETTDRDNAAQMGSSRNLILESNTLLQFWTPALYLMVIDPRKTDFKESAQAHLDRASAIILRGDLADEVPDGWDAMPLKLMVGKPMFSQLEHERLPDRLVSLVRGALFGGQASTAR